MAGELPRGIRNNNPGNIEHTDTIKWAGEILPPDAVYCRFETSFYGIRALAKNLWSYQNKDKCNTLRKIITRHAPPNENDTEAYIEHASQETFVQPDDVFDLNEWVNVFCLIKVIIKHENDNLEPYSDDEIEKAILAAGHWDG